MLYHNLGVVTLFVFNAILTTFEIVSEVIPLFLALLELNQVSKSLFPLEALQPTQHKAILSKVVILISLIICSQDCFFALSVPNSQPQ